MWNISVISWEEQKMPRINPAAESEDRLSIRASGAQKHALRTAAELRHTTMSQFVLEASLAEADRILAQETTLRVSDEEHAWLCELMDRPTRDLPELRRLLSEKPVWEP